MKRTVVIGSVSHIYEGTPEEIYRLMDMEENRFKHKFDLNVNIKPNFKAGIGEPESTVFSDSASQKAF